MIVQNSQLEQFGLISWFSAHVYLFSSSSLSKQRNKTLLIQKITIKINLANLQQLLNILFLHWQTLSNQQIYQKQLSRKIQNNRRRFPTKFESVTRVQSLEEALIGCGWDGEICEIVVDSQVMVYLKIYINRWMKKYDSTKQIILLGNYNKGSFKSKLSRVESALLLRPEHKLEDDRYFKNLQFSPYRAHQSNKLFDKKKMWEDIKIPHSTKIHENKEDPKHKINAVTCLNYISRTESRNKEEKENLERGKRNLESSYYNNHLQYKKKNEGKRHQDYKKEHTQYKKLQEKLAYLQNKIIAIKSSIETTKKKDFSLKKEEKEIEQLKPKKNYSAEKLDHYDIIIKKQKIDLQKPHPLFQQIREKEKFDKLKKKCQKSILQQRKNRKNSEIKKFQKKLEKKNSQLNTLVTNITPKAQNYNFNCFDPLLKKLNIYYIAQICKSFQNNQLLLAKDHLITSMQTLKFMSNVRKPTNAEIEEKKIFLPKSQCYRSTTSLPDKKTIIFDLDETLIHCNQSVDAPSDVSLPIRFPTGDIIKAGINIRPFAKQIIKQLSLYYQIIVFTASHSCYANEVIDYIDPDKRIAHRLYREHCWHTEQKMYVKDLRVLNRNLSDIVLVDNAAYSYAFQLQNGIPIIPYYQGKNDYELQHLMKYIESLSNVVDVREANYNYFKLSRYKQFKEGKDLVKDLYPQIWERCQL